jgi:hypothetical protein
MREPDEDQKDFVLVLKARLKRGEYITASERQDAAKIADEFPQWMRLQGMPSGSGTGEWRKASAYYSVVRARER